MSQKLLFGFHAVSVRLKVAPNSIREIHVDATRRDQRMKQFLAKAEEAGVRIIASDDDRLQALAGSSRHQGVVARVQPLKPRHSLDEVMEEVEAAGLAPLLLALDGVTDPHNLGACLRSEEHTSELQSH